MHKWASVCLSILGYEHDTMLDARQLLVLIIINIFQEELCGEKLISHSDEVFDQHSHTPLDR
jgi:hypothetical protein